MKVLHLLSSSGLFGAENVVMQLLKELGKESAETFLGILENNSNAHLTIEDQARQYTDCVKTFSCKGKFDIKAIFHLKKFILEKNIDIIHSHKYKTNVYSFLAASANIPLISTCHNWISESCKMKMYEWIDKKILSKFDRVVAVSDEVKTKILESGIPQHKVLKIKNGINVEDYIEKNEREKVRTEFGIDKDSIVIGNVGRLDENKGINNLLKVIKALSKKYEDILLLIVGDGPSWLTLQKNAKALGIEQKVIFTGFRKDIASMLSAFDIFVLPSLIEGLPMVLLEAMASRKPVIATRVGDIPHVVTHNESGLLVQPGANDQLQDAIEFIMHHSRESSLMALRGYKKVKAEYSSNHMAKQYMEIYNDALKRRVNTVKLSEVR